MDKWFRISETLLKIVVIGILELGSYRELAQSALAPPNLSHNSESARVSPVDASTVRWLRGA